MSTPVCIGNALADALGIADIRLPMTPAKILAAIGIDDPPPSAKATGAARTGSAAALDGNTSKPARGRALTARGSVDLKASPEAIFAVLLDPAALARVIPGCHALEASGPNQYRADVTVGVGLIKARFEARIALSEIEAPRRLRLAGSGLSPLGSAGGSGLVELAPHEGGTRLTYDYEAQISGKVAAVGSRMLEGAAKVILNQLFEALGREALPKSAGSAENGSWLARFMHRLRGRA
jgi:2-furoyl-CoA dehydrogenase large subunit